MICYRLNPNLVIREVVGEVMVIPVGDMVHELNGALTFTETGALLIKRLQTSAAALDELIQLILEHYDVPRENAREDIQNFLDKALQYKIILYVGIYNGQTYFCWYSYNGQVGGNPDHTLLDAICASAGVPKNKVSNDYAGWHAGPVTEDINKLFSHS